MLKLTVDSLEAIDEPLRDLYEEADDGKFRLKVEGLEDAASVEAALDRERKSRRAAEKQAEVWSKIGKSPDEIAQMVRQAEEAAVKEAERKGEWDKLRAQMNEKHAAELKERDERIAAKDRAMERFVIDGEATKAIAAAKGVPELLLPHVQRHVRVIEENGEYQVRVVDPKGDPRVNGKGEPLGVSDLVAEMRQSEVFGRAFESSGQSGSGMQPGSSGGGGGNGKGTLSRAEFNKMPPIDQAKLMSDGKIAVVD